MKKCAAFFLAVTFMIAANPRKGVASGPQSDRDLRNALHFFQIGDYRKSRRYFLAVLAEGTPAQMNLARRYLGKPQIRQASTSATSLPSRRPPPPRQREPAPPDPVLQNDDLTPALPNPSSESDDEEAQRLRLSGNLREEAAARLSAPSQLSKLRSVGILAGSGQIAKSLSYKVSARLWYNGVFDLTHHYPRAVEDDEKTDGELRDAYVDFSSGRWDWRVGKQQIVWGEAVGLFYADVVNAKDLREFVLPDFEFIRVPDWSMDVEYTRDEFHAEGIWIPFPEMDRVGRPGSEYAFPVAVPDGFLAQFNSEQTPPRSLTSSELGGRFSYRAHGWDLSVFHLRTWDKFPVYTRTLEPGLVNFTATHPRLTTDGFSFAKNVYDAILKGEVVYSWQKYFQTTDPASTTGVIPKDYVDYLLGMDYSFGKRASSALQVGQRLIRQYEKDLYQQKAVLSNVTLWLRGNFFDDRVEPELLLIHGLEAGDSLARPRLGFKASPAWKITVGADFFSGAAETLFGEFQARDRGYMEVRYDF